MGHDCAIEAAEAQTAGISQISPSQALVAGWKQMQKMGIPEAMQRQGLRGSLMSCRVEAARVSVVMAQNAASLRPDPEETTRLVPATRVPCTWLPGFSSGAAPSPAFHNVLPKVGRECKASQHSTACKLARCQLNPEYQEEGRAYLHPCIIVLTSDRVPGVFG